MSDTAKRKSDKDEKTDDNRGIAKKIKRSTRNKSATSTAAEVTPPVADPEEGWDLWSDATKPWLDFTDKMYASATDMVISSKENAAHYFDSKLFPNKTPLRIAANGGKENGKATLTTELTTQNLGIVLNWLCRNPERRAEWLAYAIAEGGRFKQNSDENLEAFLISLGTGAHAYIIDDLEGAVKTHIVTLAARIHPSEKVFEYFTAVKDDMLMLREKWIESEEDRVRKTDYVASRTLPQDFVKRATLETKYVSADSRAIRLGIYTVCCITAEQVREQVVKKLPSGEEKSLAGILATYSRQNLSNARILMSVRRAYANHRAITNMDILMANIFEILISQNCEKCKVSMSHLSCGVYNCSGY
jgi:hypothetical protein